MYIMYIGEDLFVKETERYLKYIKEDSEKELVVLCKDRRSIKLTIKNNY